MYFDPQLMPKSSTPWTHVKILDKRIPALTQTLPTFMRQYGNQHKLPLAKLMKFGLLGHFIREGPAFRFFAPHEVAMIHCQVGTVVFLKPAKLAWATVGNSISILHASFVLFQAFQLLGSIPEQASASEAVCELIQNRLTAHNAQLIEDEFAWYLGVPPDATARHQLLHFFIDEMQWNTQSGDTQRIRGTFFSPTRGRLMLEDGHTDIPDSQMILHDDPTAWDEPVNTPQPEASADTTQLDPTDSFAYWLIVQLQMIPGNYGRYKVPADHLGVPSATLE